MMHKILLKNSKDHIIHADVPEVFIFNRLLDLAREEIGVQSLVDAAPFTGGKLDVVATDEVLRY